MTTESEKRTHRCCFTGHRPEKLHADEATICVALEQAIDTAIANGFTTFISGMARGVDIWAAELVLRKRTTNPALHLICACPHPDFEKRWSDDWQLRYHDILSQADVVRTICPVFTIDAYQRRNEWMVNHSARVIAVYNGQAGGTKNTIRYSEMQQIELIVLATQLTTP